MQDLVDYLEGNSAGTEEDIKHRMFLDEIIRNLQHIGISNPKHVYKQVDMRNGSEQVGRVDIVVISDMDDLYLIEAKILLNRDKTASHLRSGLNRQLQRSYDFFKEQFGVLGIRIAAYQDRTSGRMNYYRVPIPIEDLIAQTTGK